MVKTVECLFALNLVDVSFTLKCESTLKGDDLFEPVCCSLLRSPKMNILILSMAALPLAASGFMGSFTV